MGRRWWLLLLALAVLVLAMVVRQSPNDPMEEASRQTPVPSVSVTDAVSVPASSTMPSKVPELPKCPPISDEIEELRLVERGWICKIRNDHGSITATMFEEVAPTIVDEIVDGMSTASFPLGHAVESEELLLLQVHSGRLLVVRVQPDGTFAWINASGLRGWLPSESVVVQLQALDDVVYE